MKVKELIEQLEELDPEAVLIVEPNHSESELSCIGDGYEWFCEEDSCYGEIINPDDPDSYTPEGAVPAVILFGVS